MSTSPTSPLFQRLLGDAFEALPEPVRRIHLRHGTQTYRGEVEVDRGVGLLSRLCGWVTRLPPAGRGPISVEIDASASRERWTRRVGRHVMRSQLWAADGLLCERLGLVTFGFRIGAQNGCLKWTVARVAAIGLPLPVRAFSGVFALESEADGRYTFDVTAALPLVGPLVHYRGWLHVT